MDAPTCPCQVFCVQARFTATSRVSDDHREHTYSTRHREHRLLFALDRPSENMTPQTVSTTSSTRIDSSQSKSPWLYAHVFGDWKSVAIRTLSVENDLFQWILNGFASPRTEHKYFVRVFCFVFTFARRIDLFARLHARASYSILRSRVSPE